MKIISISIVDFALVDATLRSFSSILNRLLIQSICLPFTINFFLQLPMVMGRHNLS